MSLSPLYPYFTIDLHVRTVCGLPPGFPLALSYTSIDHHLSGPEIYATTQIFHRGSWSADGAPFYRFPPILLSFRARVFNTQTLAHISDSLVRVSRRADYNHFVCVILLLIPEGTIKQCSSVTISMVLVKHPKIAILAFLKNDNPHKLPMRCTTSPKASINISQEH